MLLSGVQSLTTRPARFTYASASFCDKVKPAFKPFAKGQVAIPAIIEGITESGREPKAYACQYLQNSGTGASVIQATEFDEVVTSKLRMKAQVPKQARLARDEDVA